MPFVAIGAPGNGGDPTGNPVGAGSVAYAYNLAQYEVSRDMITKASVEGGLGITLNDMTSLGYGPPPPSPDWAIAPCETGRRRGRQGRSSPGPRRRRLKKPPDATGIDRRHVTIPE
jgi:hypothetical protein